MKTKLRLPHPLAIFTLAAALLFCPAQKSQARDTNAPPTQYPPIEPINPPESGFFTKELSFHGILIKAPEVVVNDALYRAYDRMAMETAHLPMVVTNLAAAGAELHIIGRHQVTTDLPEWRQDKHIPLDEYNGLTRDVRTRGMGGLITSCGEENLLKLPRGEDRYFDSDICIHEFAHNIEGAGMGPEIRAKFNAQYKISQDKGLWLGTYAGSNPNEYFAELTMWYFTTHGSYNGFQGDRPGNGPEGLKKYDPDAYALFDEFYSGRMDIPKLEPRARRRPPGTNGVARQRMSRDSRPARVVVAKLTDYKVGRTKITDFLPDAGMTTPADHGTNGWWVTLRGAAPETATAAPADENAPLKFNVMFRDPRDPPRQPFRGGAARAGAAGATPAAGTNAAARPGARANRGGGRARTGDLCDLDFKDGVLTAFKWNN